MHVVRPALEGWFSKHHLGVRHDLGETMVPADRKRLLERASGRVLETAYPPSNGTADVRALVATCEGLGPEELLLTCGCTEANAVAMFAVARPGAVALVQDPLYYQFRPLLEALGVQVVNWTAGTALPIVADLCAIVVNSPHNPTGDVLTLDDLVRRVSGDADAWLVVDEVYREVTSGSPLTAALKSPKVVVTNSFAKRWGMPGLRLGWLACRDAELLSRALAWHEHLTHSPPRPSELLVASSWPGLHAGVLEAQGIAARNLAIFREWLSGQAKFVGRVPEAGVTTLLWRDGEADDEALGLRLRQGDLFVVPGRFLGYPGAIRVGLGHREGADLLAALEQLEAQG